MDSNIGSRVPVFRSGLMSFELILVRRVTVKKLAIVGRCLFSRFSFFRCLSWLTFMVVKQLRPMSASRTGRDSSGITVGIRDQWAIFRAKESLALINLEETSACCFLTGPLWEQRDQFWKLFGVPVSASARSFWGLGSLGVSLSFYPQDVCYGVSIHFSSHLQLLIRPYFPSFDLFPLCWPLLPCHRYICSSDTLYGPSQRISFPLASLTLLIFISPCLCW